MEEEYLKFWNTCDINEFNRWDVSGKQWKDTIREYIAEKKFTSVLDCGAGNFSEYYSFEEDGIDIKYTGIDITKRFVEKAKAKGIDAFHCSIQNMPFENNSFDVVICYDIINHQKEIMPCIDEAMRVAKKEVIVGFHAPWIEQPEGWNHSTNAKPELIWEEGIKMGVVVYKEGHLTNFISKKGLIKAMEKRKWEFAFETVQFNTMVWSRQDDGTSRLISTPQVLPKNILNIWKE